MNGDATNISADQLHLTHVDPNTQLQAFPACGHITLPRPEAAALDISRDSHSARSCRVPALIWSCTASFLIQHAKYLADFPLHRHRWQEERHLNQPASTKVLDCSATPRARATGEC